MKFWKIKPHRQEEVNDFQSFKPEGGWIDKYPEMLQGLETTLYDAIMVDNDTTHLSITIEMYNIVVKYNTNSDT